MQKNRKNIQNNKKFILNKAINKAIKDLHSEIDQLIKKILVNKQDLTIKNIVDYCREGKYPELLSECKIKIIKTLLKIKDLNLLIFYLKKTPNHELRKLIAGRIRKLKKSIKQSQHTSNTSKNQPT